MFTTTTDNDGSTLTLHLAGDLTLEHCTEVHAALLKYKDEPRLRLSLQEVIRMDLSILQLLQALIHSRERDNKQLEFGPIPDVLVSLAATLGAGTLLKTVCAHTGEAA